MPMLAGFLALFHFAFIVPLLILTGTTESTQYECNEKFAVRFSLFSILALYLISLFVEVAVVVFGLRGGPLEVNRRRAVPVLIHFAVILWILILAITCFATYVGASDRVAQSCWSENPCEYSQDVIPAACTVNKTGDVTLSPPCLAIWNRPSEFESCFVEWVNYAATAMVNYYEYSTPNPKYELDPVNEYLLTPHFTSVNSQNYQCADNIKFVSKQFDDFIVKAFGEGAVEDDKQIQDWQKRQENVALAYELYLLRALNVTHTNTSAGSDAPWFKCFTPKCQAWIVDGDECTEWRTMVNIPSANNRKTAYLATVYSSWAILIVQGLVVYIAFNAWQNYEKEESWEGSIRGCGRFLGCDKNLEEAETEGGTNAAKEIGSLLHMLFGGIDLDATDQFLGMYLVSERQRLRRHNHVLRILKESGIEPSPRPVSRSKACCTALFRNPIRRFADWYHRRDDVDLVATLEGPDGIQDVNSDDGVDEVVVGSSSSPKGGNSGNSSTVIANNNELKSTLSSTINGTAATSTATTATATPPATTEAKGQPKVQFSELPPSPFDAIAEEPDTTLATTQKSTKTASSTNFTGSGKSRGGPKSAKRSIAYTPPAIAHSFVRLVSLKPSSSLQRAATSSAATTALSITESALKKKLVVEERNQPLATPVTLHSLSTRLPISSYEAAILCGLGQKLPVEKPLLQKAMDLSMFAKAAYGLQTVKWAHASETAGCMNSTYDTLLSCALCSPCRTPLGFDTHFRKRNFHAILELTGIEPSDLLYVSYTSAAFGVLPYMVVLHRPTRSVVVSVRGTVGFNDLITDLLSNPVDASEAVPEWVKNEIGEDAPMYAHSGILSSTRAVMKDLKEKGLLDAMMKTASSGLNGSSSNTHITSGGGCEGSNINVNVNGATDKDSQNNGKSGFVDDLPSSLDRISTTAAFVKQGSKIADKSASNNRILHKLRTLGDDDKVDLDLNRAQSVVDEALNNQGWNVVVTGHSLGAAVACMMSFGLRQYFPTLQCYAFCPPGGLISPALAEVAKQFCTSVVVGCDAITRVSFPNTQRVVDDMVLALARCKRPKLAILLDAIVGRRKNPETTPPTFCAFEDIGPEARLALKKYVATSKLHSKDADKRDLFPPGKLIHLRPFAAAGVKGKNVKNDVWDAVWVSGEELIAEGVLLTLDMLRHHRVPTLQLALESALKDEAVKTLRPGFHDMESQQLSLVSEVGTVDSGKVPPI
jgi:hypothetical protein